MKIIGKGDEHGSVPINDNREQITSGSDYVCDHSRDMPAVVNYKIIVNEM